MTFDQIKQVFLLHGCKKIYVKELSPNDNSKNQVYLGGSFEVLNIFPITEINADNSGNRSRDTFKARIDFAWINNDGNIFPAPNAQLILFPKYPEVRFSGFLSKCIEAPSALMTSRELGRVLFFAVTNQGKVLGHVVHKESTLNNYYRQLDGLLKHGLLSIINIDTTEDSRSILVDAMTRIHNKGWILSKRLDRFGNQLPCNAPNCGGYTLEAELGITPNGFSEPDFHGWEVKQFGVKDYEKIETQIITLMTPEPTGGIYTEKGVEYFIRQYGYPDKLGRVDRMNFGGIHKINQYQSLTNLTMCLVGFDVSTGKIVSTDGRIALIDSQGNEAACWHFSNLLQHWNRKHHQACYVPCKSIDKPYRQYQYGHTLILGIGTDFLRFLNLMSRGEIWYDPGIKMESASNSPKIKRRSQFRVKSRSLKDLYAENEIVRLP